MTEDMTDNYLYTMENAGFQAILLVVLFVYCWMLYRFRREIFDSLKSVLTLKTEDVPLRFVTIALGMGTVAVGIAVVKTGRLSPVPVPAAAAVLLVGFAVGIVAAFQLGVLKYIGKLTFSQEFTNTLIRTRQAYLAAATVLAVPPVLLWSGVNPVRDEVLMYIAGTELIATAVMFTVHSFLLFIKQKVSVLVWFLYLCAVEIFPVSLVVLLAAKSV